MDSRRDIISRISDRQMRSWHVLYPKGVVHCFIAVFQDEGTLRDENAWTYTTRSRTQPYEIGDKRCSNVVSVADNLSANQIVISVPSMLKTEAELSYAYPTAHRYSVTFR